MTKRQCRMNRSAPAALLACAAATISIAAAPAVADSQPHDDAAAISGPAPGVNNFTYTSARLADIPDSFRYQPRDRHRQVMPAPAGDAAGHDAAQSRAGARVARLSASNTEFVDRSAVINRLKELDSLQLIRFWESEDLCLYLGVSDRGFAGLNLTLRDTTASGRSGGGDDDDAFLARSTAVRQFIELTGERQPTFPAPPSLHAALAGD